MNAKPNYDYGYIRVDMIGAGNFGSVSMSGIKYEDERHLEEASSEIKRHVDRVRSVDIHYDYYTCGKCDDDFESEKEAEECCNEVEEIPN